MNPSRHRTKLSRSDEWATPAWLWEYCVRWYGPFAIDVAAAKWNAKCRRYFTKDDGALERVWCEPDERAFWNPPYSSGFKSQFARWARAQILQFDGALNCGVIPHDTAERYWADNIEAPAGRYLGVSKTWRELGPVVQTRWQHLTVEVTAVNRRVGFTHESGEEQSNSWKPTAVVVFASPDVLKPLVQTPGRFKGAA